MTRGDASDDPRVLRSRIGPEHAGRSVIDYLVLRFPYQDRAAWLQEIAAGRITVDGSPAAAARLLGRRSQVGWLRTKKEPEVCADIEILHRGADYLVVAKPAHLPMHADGPFIRNTLVHLLGQVAGHRVTLVHRLDRETSGVVLVASTAAAARRLAPRFESGQAQKVYLAVVQGHLSAPQTCAAAIGRAPASTIALRRTGAADALEPQAAVTEFEPLAAAGDHTLVLCRPRTGRTHQIRVHLEAIGHPILGDKLYGRPDADYLAFVQAVKRSGDPRAVPSGQPDRQLLHAWRLTLPVGEGPEPSAFVAPVPLDFAAWCTRLGLAIPSP